MSHAITGSLPWDLSGRTKSPEEYKAWCEKRAKERTGCSFPACRCDPKSRCPEAKVRADRILTALKDGS